MLGFLRKIQIFPAIPQAPRIIIIMTKAISSAGRLPYIGIYMRTDPHYPQTKPHDANNNRLANRTT